MADETFGIIVEVNPRPALDGQAQVDRGFGRNEASAREFEAEAKRAMAEVAKSAKEAAREQERAAKEAAKAQAAAARSAAKEAAQAQKQAARDVEEGARAAIVAAERRARTRAEIESEAARKAAAAQKEAASQVAAAQKAAAEKATAAERARTAAAKASADAQKRTIDHLAAGYKSIVGPIAEYNQKLSLAIQLEQRGAITAQQRAQYVRGLQREVDQYNAKQRGGFRGAVSEIASSQLGAVAGPAAAAATAIAAGREFIALSDAYKNLTNRIRTVTTSEAEALAVRAKLLDLSNRTRSDVGATTEGYVRLASATKNLNLSQSQLLSFTESLNKTIKLSGATGAEAQAGLIQFAQGLGAGALRGDELRSVIEQLGPVADVIAKQLGTTRAGLKAFGEQGKITADVVVAAFAAQREEIDGKFAKSVATFGDLWTVLHNAIMAAVGQIVEAVGGMPALEKAAQAATKSIAEMSHGFVTAIKDAKAFASQVADLGGVLTQLTGDSDLASIATGNFFSNYGKAVDKIRGKSLGDAMNAEAAKINEAIANWSKLVTAWQKIIGGNALVDRAMGGIGGGDVDAVVKAGLKRQKDAEEAARKHAAAVREAGAAWKEWLGEVRESGAGVMERTKLRIDDVRDSLVSAATEGIDKYNKAQEAMAEQAKSTAKEIERVTYGAHSLEEQILADLEAAGLTAGKLGDIVAVKLGGALSDALDAFVDFANGSKVSFSDLARSVLADIERMLLKMLAFQGIKAALGGLGAADSTIGAFASAFGAVGFAAGGTVVAGGSGGVDSVPFTARVSPGERITFTPPGREPNGASARPANVNVKTVIVHDAQAAALEALRSADGERVIISAIAANPGAVRAAVSR